METEVRKKEPMYFKKYSNIKNANEAKNLISLVRQRQRVLHRLEVMTYRKYLDILHGLKSPDVKLKSSLLYKERSSNFEQLFLALKTQISRSTHEEPKASRASEITTVGIENEAFESAV